MAAKAIPGKVCRGFPSGIAKRPKVILHAALLAAAAFVAAPAFAQTNDPSLTQKQVDCLNRTTAAGGDCDKDGGAKGRSATKKASAKKASAKKKAPGKRAARKATSKRPSSSRSAAAKKAARTRARNR